MLKKFSKLIWLGAGQANTPAGLFNQAEQVLLVESREEACRDLVKKTAGFNQVKVQQSTISTLAGEVNFYRYNLAEFSALMPATGLVEFFPGLKLVQQEKVHSVGISEFIADLKLSDRNNLLVLDLADISLALLTKLASTQQLQSFSEIRLVAAESALYQQSSHRQQITDSLQQSGFYLTAADELDPDLPWLTFQANPLWFELESGKQQLQQAAAREAEMAKELASAKQQAQSLSQQQATLQQQLSAETADSSAKLQQAAAREAELAKELASAKQQVQSLSQQQQQLSVENANSRTQLQQAAEREAGLTKQVDSFKQQLAEESKLCEEQQQQLQLEASSNKDLLAQLATAKVAAEKQQADYQASLSGKDSALSALKLQLEQTSTELASLNHQQQQLKAECEQHKAALQTKTLENTKSQTEQAAQLAKLKADLEQVSKHAAQRLEKIALLEKTNRQLQEQNQQLAKRQQLLEQEMLKAEAQIDIIKELILKP